MTTHELARQLLELPDCPAVINLQRRAVANGCEVTEVRRVVAQFDAAAGEYYVSDTVAKVGCGSALSGFVVDITA